MITLSAQQCRVIGVMLEKEITTPEQYPLSLNALTSGCNQKSNREPVMSLSESDVQNVVDQLIQMNIFMVDQMSSGRVNKYIHRFCNTQFSDLQFTPQQKAIICVLLLRGPQTPGELRTRTNRLADFNDVSEVETTLQQLKHLNDIEFVKQLARQPGKRDSRYVHLFSDIEVNLTFENETFTQAEQAEQAPLGSQSELVARIEVLEQTVASLTDDVALLTELLENK
ncbi:YceH family protein [Colwelliaceae bacterium BS250]